jgi:hypothetical protein
MLRLEATMAERVRAMGFLAHDEIWCVAGRGFASLFGGVFHPANWQSFLIRKCNLF